MWQNKKDSEEKYRCIQYTKIMGSDKSSIIETKEVKTAY